MLSLIRKNEQVFKNLCLSKNIPNKFSRKGILKSSIFFFFMWLPIKLKKINKNYNCQPIYLTHPCNHSCWSTLAKARHLHVPPM